MLAIATIDALVLLDAPTLKHPPSSSSACQSLIYKPTSSAWSPDNTSLFLASASAIHRYDPSINSFHCIYSSNNNSLPISNLVAKDKGNTLIFSVAQSMHVLECGSGKVVQTFNTHRSPVTSLALSNDCTLLGSTAPGAVHVHNLALGSHTVLRGLPTPGVRINTCIFHTHSRTRLLLGAGRQLLIYDTTRPSSPMKVIPMGDGSKGEIICIACSPFSKTLVAFATDAGNVSLVDLEKGKALFRTINVSVPLTSLAFSQEGAAVYTGTENGKLFIIELRALDKPQKVINVSDTGSRIETISIQKKLRAESGTKSTTGTSTSVRLSTQPDLVRKAPAANGPNKVPIAKPVAKPIPKAPTGNSPAQARIRGGTTATPPSREKKKSSLSSPGLVRAGKPNTPPKIKLSPPVTKKNILSPARDPLRNSKCDDGRISLSAKDLGVKAFGNAEADEPTIVIQTRVSISPRVSTASKRGSTLDVPSARSRSRSTSVTSRSTATSKSGSEVMSARGSARNASTASSVSAQSSAVPDSEPGSPISHAVSPFPLLPAKLLDKKPGGATARTGAMLSGHVNLGPKTNDMLLEEGSRTPSPDLPDIEEDTCPLPPITTNWTALGLEVNRCIAAGRGEKTREEEARKRERKGKSKNVAFEGAGRDSDTQQERKPEDVHKAEQNLAVQVSPRRSIANVPTAAQWTSSPLRHLAVDPSSAPMSSAHDLLRTIVCDVMYDFRQETRAEMMGLHLDLVRMGRGWRRELRELMEEYVGDLRDLREENKRLREDNERLRRVR